MNDKPRVFNGDHIIWLCECGNRMPAISYPINLRFDTVEVTCDNLDCKNYQKVIAVRLVPAEVVYFKDKIESI